VWCRVLCLALVGVGSIHDSVSAEQRSTPAASNELIAFDLPSQTLISAIESYSIVSGWQVIYDASLATGRRSAPVKGDFVPADALQRLLGGTGLVPQYVAADGVMLIPDSTATSAREEMPFDPQKPFRGYYGRIQASLKRAFCEDRQIRSGAYRIALGFWIGASGTVTRAEALGSTGKPEIDAAFDRAVYALSIGAPPPAGFVQPVVILVTPDLVSQCNIAGVEPVRAPR